MIVKAFLIGESAWAKGAIVNETVIEMFSLHKILSTCYNFVGELITNSAMVFAIIKPLQKLNQVFWVGNCGA